MNKVFFDVGISLDGFIAGENRGPKNPLGDGGLAIHQWMFKQRSFLERLKLTGMGTGNTDNADNDIIEYTFNRIGANIMGKRMFEEGEANWPGEAPFGVPVFVISHSPREPWEREGGTVFYFVNEPVEAVLERAKRVAGTKDIRISGGADVIRQYLNAGLIDEMSVHIAPLMIGKGIKLFENVHHDQIALDITDVIHSPCVTHVTYNVRKK
jgi:dihydrofolate reductase